jgi:uncharacterized integral membrane protein
MRAKTIFLFTTAILLTIIIIQNNQQVKFNILFAQFYVSNLLVIAFAVVIAFITGLFVGRSKKVKANTTPDAHNPKGGKANSQTGKNHYHLN